ncbi:MFS transporter [Priestia aryabhattai]|uniref:MFS transporter n=1 Tax=Priestia TaxID=2800373 RepID=UPI001ED0D75E|nr:MULTISPECIES: MFS transporter [Priestia]MBY0089642.1 MFS transporter [Priestia aryabhattai]MBY0100769.1 MFS transporter [Priestia aryabhattai]MCM3303911.1 MFS transporter [Priestia megaterium]
MSAISTVKDKYLFAAVSFIFWFSQFIYVPILSPYMEGLGGKYAFIGVVLSSYGLMQLLCRLPLGIFSDFVKMRKPFVILGMIASMSSCLLFSLTDSLIGVFISRCLAGLAAATWVAFTILYSSYFEREKTTRAMNIISFIVVLAQLLGMSLSGYIVSELGWHAPFWIGTILSVIGAILSLFIYEPKENVKRSPIKLKELMSVIKEPSLLKISLLSILAHSIIFTTMFGFTPAYALSAGFKESELSLIVFSFMIPHAAAPLIMEKLFVWRFGKWSILKAAFFLATFFTCMIPMTENKLLLCIIQSVNGFSLGLVFPLMLGMSIERIAAEKRATAMGGYQALYALGIFGGPFAAGILNSWTGLKAGFFFAAALGLTATAFAAAWDKKEASYKVFKAK